LKDVKNAIKDLNENISDDHIEKILKTNEIDNQKFIDFKEFRNLFIELVAIYDQNIDNKDNIFHFVNTSYSIHDSDQEEGYEQLFGKQTSKKKRQNNSQINFEIQLHNFDEKLNFW
jgi:hypothetical protein